MGAQLDEVAIEGALSGNLRLIFQARAHDPLTAAMLWPAEIKGMVNALFAQNRGYLQQF
jgi:alpha-galactosidase